MAEAFEVEVTFVNARPEALALCMVGEDLAIWTRPEMDELFFYSRRTCGGQGLIARVRKHLLADILPHLSSLTTEIVAKSDSTLTVAVRYTQGEDDLPF